MLITIKPYGIICMYMDKFVVLFSSKIFIVPAFIMNWTFIYIKLLIYWSSAASFTYQTSGSVVKRTGRLVPAKTATCKYISLFSGILYFEEKAKNMILSFIHSSYKTSALLTSFLGLAGAANFHSKLLQASRPRKRK